MDKQKNIKEYFIHDGRAFFTSEESVNSGEEIIGFYFDDLNICHPIKRKPMYGEMIIKRFLS